MIVYDQNHKPQELGDLLAKGGEGGIYHLVDESKKHVLVKIYFPERLAKNKDILEKKITAMRDHPLRKHLKKIKQCSISWASIPIYNEQKQWIGYAMRKIDGRPLQSLAHPALYKKHAPNLNRLDIANLMLSWLNGIELLHKHNVMIGDYNLQNFLWDPTNLNNIGFIDCDSYQLSYKDKFYPCLVGSPDLTAPEHHGKNFKEIKRTLESEYFSIAIILFKCFMLGRHPYDIVGGEDPVKNMRNGQFLYGKGKDGYKLIPKGPWFNIWSHMSFDMKSLFIRTFTEGSNNPKKRATLKEWQAILKKYIYEIGKNFHDIDIRPEHPKQAKPKTSE